MSTGFYFTCCCASGEWFDFYDQVDDHFGSGTDDGVVRTGACTPPNTDPDAYDSGEYTAEPYETDNSEGSYITLGTVSSFSDDDLGDYVWYVINISGDQYLQLYKCEANEAGPQEQWSMNGYDATASGPWPSRWAAPITLYFPGNDDHMRRDGITGAPQNPYGKYQQTIAFLNGRMRTNSAGELQFCDSSSGDVVDIDKTGSDSTTALTAESPTTRATDDARIMIHALRAFPWAAGLSIELSNPSSGVVRHTLKFYTGQQSSGSVENCDKTNLIATKTLDASCTVGQEATTIANFYNTSGPPTSEGFPDSFWNIGFYDRNENGNEIIQLIKHEFRVNTPTFEEEEWYIDGTLFYSGTTWKTVGSDQFGGILGAIAVDPDPALSTDTKFIILRANDSSRNDYELVGVDADGDDVWTDGATHPYSSAEIIDASDRYVYMSGTDYNASTESGGEITHSGDKFMVRLDEGVKWPFVEHSTTTQLTRTSILNGVQGTASIKSSLVPLSADIDIAAQWDANYT